MCFGNEVRVASFVGLVEVLYVAATGTAPGAMWDYGESYS